MYDIDWINDCAAAVDYSEQAVREYEQGQGSRIDEYTLQFEQDYAAVVSDTVRDDIGGLKVYLRENRVVAVYDYENFCGWLA